MLLSWQIFSALEIALLASGTVLWITAVVHGRIKNWWNAPARMVRWQIAPSDFVLFGLVLIGCVGAGSFAAARIFHLDPVSAETTRGVLVSGLSLHLSALTACVIVVLHPVGRPLAGHPHPAPIRVTLQTFVYLMPPLVGITFLWSWLLTTWGFDAEPQALVGFFREAGDPRELALLIVLAVVVAPITEELVFRVGVFRFLTNYLPAAWAAVISSALFAAPHWNLLSALPLFLLGLVLSFLYQKTGRVTAPILLHALFNLNTVLVVLLEPSGTASNLP